MKRWSLGLASVFRGKAGAAFQTAFYLLATAGLVFALMTLAACDCDNDGYDDCDYDRPQNDWVWRTSTLNQETPQPTPEVRPRIQKTGSVRTESLTLTRELHGLMVFDPLPSYSIPLTYTWYPPAGASNFDFLSQDPEPGGPPFVFRNVPAYNSAIAVMFDMPATGVYGGDQLPELLTAQQGAGPQATALMRNTLGQTQSLTEVPLSGAEAAAALPLPAATAGRTQATVDMWTVDQWFAREGVTVTTETCQQAVDLLQSDAAFIAVQVPEPPHTEYDSALLPIYGDAVLALDDLDGGLDLEAAATFRPEQFTFLANTLPQEEGKIWVALGVQQASALTCPVAAPSGAWEIHTGLTLDLSFVPDNCAGCVLDVQVCYEAQELPGNAAQRFVMGRAFDSALERLAEAAPNASVQNYRDWGVTCAGPLPLQLVDNVNSDRWVLEGDSAQWITPTWTLTLPHQLTGGDFSPPALIDLEFAAPIGTNWHWSNGVTTLTPPVSFAGGWPPTNIYLVGTIPAGTPAGLYTVNITATQHTTPADFRVGSDIIWVGEWSPPPEGGDPPRFVIYLPLVLRIQGAP
ncbi:MAG: hypothetical protein RBT75_02745 [Anaerolineae bacterium]|jgi:hypothetical protein|nr:hypothetical protein [Anaerolineae bacterium]